jgi:hypothetical protein
MKMARRSEVLDLAVEGKAKKKSRKGLIVGIAMLGVIPVIGSTLAATITLNTGAIEFGQGQVAVTACDDFTVELVSGYASGAFKLDKIKLVGVDASATSSGTTGCAGESFTVIARNSSGAAVTNGTVTFDMPAATGTTGANASGATISSWTAGETAADIELTLASTVAAADVAKITVETN